MIAEGACLGYSPDQPFTMKPDKQELKQKEIRKLKKRERQVWQEIRSQPLIELEKPFTKGWEIYYDLKSEIARRKDADQIREKLQLTYPEGRLTRAAVEVRMVRSGKSGYGTHKTHRIDVNPDLMSEAVIIRRKLKTEQRNFYKDDYKYPAGRKRVETRTQIHNFTRGIQNEID